MSEDKYPINGSCQCGNVSYQLLEAPMMLFACHCKACQKLSTSAFSLTAVLKAESVVFEGELNQWERIADSGNRNVAMFCPTCGNRIYHFNPEDPGTIKLKPANLDNTSILNPTVHIWVSEKQDWYQIPEGATQHEKQPPPK